MTTLVFALIAAGLAGVLLAPLLGDRPDLRAHCTAFAAGVLIAVILTHVVPESLEHGDRFAGATILVGFLAMLFLQQKVLEADPCCGHEHAQHAGLPSYLAMVACSVNDGLLLAKAPGPGDALFWAMCTHKLTATFSLVMLLRETSAGLKPAARTIYMLLFVAITPAVVILSNELSALKGYLNYAVALGAGALLYVICGGMVPRVEHTAQEGRKFVLLVFLAGAAATVTVETMVPHAPH